MFDFAGVPFGFVNQDVEFAGNGVEADQVAGTDFGDVAAHQGFWRHVDGGRNLTGRAGHTAVGQQRHFEAAVLQDTQRRGQFVQLGHTVGARALVADNTHKIAFQLAALKRSQHFALVVEHDGGRFDDAAAFAHGRHFNHAASDVTFHQAQTTVRGERVVGFAQDVVVAAGFGRFAPFEFAVDEERLFGVVAHTVSDDGIDIVDCDGVVIKNSFFNAADDVLCFKSHDPNSICQNVVVDNCVGRSGANGLKFGTVSRGGFRNFKVTNITIYDTYRSAITFAAVDGGLIENIFVDGVRSINTGNVIFLRIGDRWSHGKKPSMKGVTIQNVYAEVPLRKPDAGYNYEGPIEDMPRNISPASIIGLPEYPIEDVTLKNITMVYPGGGNKFFAYRGTTPAELDSIPEMPTRYPEFSQFKELPAWGFYVRHAKGITFDNIKFIAEKGGDYRPCIVTDDVDGFKMTNVEFEEPGAEGKEQVVTYKTTVIE